MTLSITELSVNDPQHNNTNAIMLSVVNISGYANCHYAGSEYDYAKCHYAECRYAECRSATKRMPITGNKIL